LVWLGGRAALHVRHDAAVELVTIAPDTESEGFVVLSLRVLGPEATLVLEATREGRPIAERSVRLPVALGEAQLTLPRSLLAGPSELALSVVLPPGRKQGIVDLFAAGRWSATQAFVESPASAHQPSEPNDQPERPVFVPPTWLSPGLVRIQAHADRFAGEGAGARMVYLRAPAESAAQALQQIGRALRAAGFETLPLGAADQLRPGANAELTAEFLLSQLETLRVPLPRAVSGRPPELARLSRAQSALRFGVGGMLTLSALVVGWGLLRRGFSAEAEARAILEEAAEETGEARNNEPHSGVLVVVCLGLAVSLAFVLAALLIVAKPLWF
jgi:hypothetical protein